MSRSDVDRLTDIIRAAEAIARHLDRGDVTDDLVFDAIRVRLIEIGEAVKDISEATLSLAPEIPWAEIAGMRDHLAHRYFDTARSIVEVTARRDVPRVLAATRQLRADLLRS